ncbi:MAG: FtsX-like permease family protein [Thermofilaceae archaeon]
MSVGEIGEIRFPLSEAFYISLQNIRRRFTRIAITTASVMLGIAFFVSLMMMASFQAQAGGSGIQPYMYWLLFISLMVCGVGITNSMLIAVAERYKEIGTYKCLGALDRHILMLFLVEAMLVGGIGGLAGYLAGLLAAIIYAFVNPAVGGLSNAVQVLLSPNPTIPMASTLPVSLALFLLGIGIAVLLSLIATLYPAYYAARLNPAEALRYEV